MPGRVWLGKGAKFPQTQPALTQMQKSGRALLDRWTEPCLLWSAWDESGSTTLRSPAGRFQPEMLRRFAALADKTDEAIASFARTFGVLGLCVHRLPRSHGDGCSFVGDRLALEEPLWAWREWSARARAILALAEAHRRNRLGQITDCRDLLGGQQVEVIRLDDSDDRPAKIDREIPWREQTDHDPLELERTELLKVLDEWLKLGQVRLGVAWIGGEHRVATKSAGLFGALGLQLLLVVMQSPGLSICKGCSDAFTPSAKNRTYCQDCGEDQRARARERKRRQRARAAGATPAS